jgi:tripartite-type tricarboxylate transporter receptor subunit TctC
VLQKIATAGAEPVGIEGEDFKKVIRQEVELNKQLVKIANIQPE